MSIQITISEKEILEKPNDAQLGTYIRSKFNHEKFIDNNSFDKCVVCGAETPYTKGTPISKREGYVVGGGQGCYKPNECEK